MPKRVNTTKKARLALCKELGYTEDDMQRFWDECVEIGHGTICALKRSGFNWTDLTVFQMRQLPTAKEEALRGRAERADEEKKKADEEQKRKEAKAYYEEHFEELMIQKIENKEELTGSELKRLVNEYEHEVNYDSDVYKHQRYVTTIVKLLDRFFCIDWREDLSDYGEHQYDNQPYEVEEHSYEKTIVVKEWRKK